jgi:hypothetical protein
MTAPTPQPKPQVREKSAPMIAKPVQAVGDARAVEPRATRRGPVRAVPQRVARRVPIARARVGPVESVRAGASPRVTRRAGSSRARVEGPRRQWSGARAVQAGRPTRERGPRVAAGPAARFGTAPRTGRPAAAGNSARFTPRPRSTRAAAGRAAPRRRGGARA